MKEFIIRRYRSEQSPASERQTVLRIDDEGKVTFEYEKEKALEKAKYHEELELIEENEKKKQCLPRPGM